MPIGPHSSLGRGTKTTPKPKGYPHGDAVKSCQPMTQPWKSLPAPERLTALAILFQFYHDVPSALSAPEIALLVDLGLVAVPSAHVYVLSDLGRAHLAQIARLEMPAQRTTYVDAAGEPLSLLEV